LVHGDFKCSNVMLVSTPNGFRPVITDFGLAAPAGSVHPNLRGTPGFMAPEQLRGEPVTPATDVFAVGALIRQVAQIRPRDSKWLAVVNRCLQPEPGKRYANVTDVVAALTTSRPWSPVVLAGAVGGLLLLVAVLKTPPSEAPVIAFIEPFSEPPEIAQPGPPSLPVALGAMPIPSQAAPIPPPNPTDKAVDRLLWDGAFQSAGSISADGKLFAYTDPSTGNLAIRDLATGQSRLLTRKPSDGEGSRAAARESILSPDKKYVVFHWFEGFVANSGRQVRSEIKLASLDKPEGDPRTLLLATTQALIRPYLWSPDSKRVLINQSFSVNNHQLAWLSVADGNLTALKTLTGAPRGVSLSPDGRYLAYDEGGDIRIRDLTTDDDEAIVEGPSMDTSPVWSSDGRSLLFTSARSGPPSLWRIAVDSGTRAGPDELVKANSPGVLGITPSGGLYYVAGGSRQNIFIAGTGAPALAVTQFVGSNFDSSWSPNGEMLAYKSARGRDGLRSLVILPWGSQQEHVVPTNIQYVDTPIVWFPDGKSLLMAGRLLPMGRGGEGLYRVDADSGQVQLVKSGIPNFYVLTRDGKAIYLTRSNPETRDSEGIIERFEVETGVSTVFKRYSTKGHRFGSMALSPDGTRLAVLSEHNASAETSLEVYPLDGGDAQEVYKGPMNRTPGNGGLAWSGDHTHILFVHAEANGISMDVSIWKAPLNGGVAEPAGVTIPSLNARALSGLSRRPGSDSFTYTKFETFSELHVLENFLSSGK
jgi:Tol biopolymer transport system component